MYKIAHIFLTNRNNVTTVIFDFIPSRKRMIFSFYFRWSFLLLKTSCHQQWNLISWFFFAATYIVVYLHLTFTSSECHLTHHFEWWTIYSLLSLVERTGNESRFSNRWTIHRNKEFVSSFFPLSFWVTENGNRSRTSRKRIVYRMFFAIVVIVIVVGGFDKHIRYGLWLIS